MNQRNKDDADSFTARNARFLPEQGRYENYKEVVARIAAEFGPPREANAPLPTAADGSVAVDNLTESDQHRRRTVVSIDTGRVEAERVIALEERRERAERWALRAGALCGYVTLIVELWRLGQGL
jgi:hypothetical protein